MTRFSAHAPRDGRGRPDPDWLTLGRAARYLGVAQSTLRAWSDDGRVPAFYTPGGHRRFRRPDLDAFLERSGPGRARSGPIVLVVDDDARVRARLRGALERAGYGVREAAGAELVLPASEERAPDLILLDLRMPQVDGWETLRRAQERYGAAAIPIVTFVGGEGLDLEQIVARARAATPRT